GFAGPFHARAVRARCDRSGDAGARRRARSRAAEGRVAPGCAQRARRGDAHAAGDRRRRTRRQAWRAQRAPRIHSDRDAAHAAHVSGMPVVSAAPGTRDSRRDTAAAAPRVQGVAIVPSGAGSLEDLAWRTLRAVPDPEIPVISVVDLGIVRYVKQTGD